MKKMFLAITVGSAITTQMSMASSARPEVIYGEDSRIDSVAATSREVKKNKNAVAIMIQSGSIEEVDRELDLFKVKKPSYSSIDMLCSDEAFKDQITVGSCTGFLVAPDLLITAGHCVNQESDCADNAWVFGHEVSGMHKAGYSLHLGSDIYRCSEILEVAVPGDSTPKWDKRDYSLIKLDRAVSGRAPVTLRPLETHTLSLEDKVYMIGHPAGLPMKITQKADVKFSAHKEFFWANLDAVGGNSGSPVFNEKTHEVEGILVYGQNDYVYDYKNICMREARCSEGEGCSKPIEPLKLPSFPSLTRSVSLRTNGERLREWGRASMEEVLDSDRDLHFERVTKIQAVPNLEGHIAESLKRFPQ
jgi:V8-like Glu-specific endopeptidase